jgi:hypothetical protein
MKQNVKLILGAVLMIFFLFTYLYIPNKIVVSNNLFVYQAGTSVTRGLTQIEYWDKWVPYKSIEGHSFILEEGKLEVVESFIASAKTNYLLGDKTTPVFFSAVDAGKDSSLLRFEAVIDNRHLSPITRIENFFTSKHIERNMNALLQKAGSYYNTTLGVYGFDIKETRVKDTTLITVQKNLTDTPTNVQIYALIDKLTQNIKNKNGIVHGDPMVNITWQGEKNVFLQVAFPLAADIATEGEHQIKKMVLGNILVVKVKGDNNKIRLALQATETFIHDHLRTSPAMPYVTYNTNRLLEKDSKKWESTIYYPIY